MNILKKISSVLAIFTIAFAVISCGSKYNKIKFKDPNAGDERIYGKDSTQASGEAAATPAQ